jgi:hypothetical protein
MFIYVTAVYVSSDPGTYMVRTRFTFKTGCDIMCLSFWYKYIFLILLVPKLRLMCVQVYFYTECT